MSYTTHSSTPRLSLIVRTTTMSTSTTPLTDADTKRILTVMGGTPVPPQRNEFADARVLPSSSPSWYPFTKRCFNRQEELDTCVASFFNVLSVLCVIAFSIYCWMVDTVSRSYGECDVIQISDHSYRMNCTSNELEDLLDVTSTGMTFSWIYGVLMMGIWIFMILYMRCSETSTSFDLFDLYMVYGVYASQVVIAFIGYYLYFYMVHTAFSHPSDDVKTNEEGSGIQYNGFDDVGYFILVGVVLCNSTIWVTVFNMVRMFVYINKHPQRFTCNLCSICCTACCTAIETCCSPKVRPPRPTIVAIPV